MLLHKGVINMRSENSLIQPRLLRPKDAAKYLAMNKNQFNNLVRPFIPHHEWGERSIAFDIQDLNNWLDRKRTNVIPPKQSMETTSWQEEQKDSQKGAIFGTSAKRSKENDFTKALAQANLKRPKGS